MATAPLILARRPRPGGRRAAGLALALAVLAGTVPGRAAEPPFPYELDNGREAAVLGGAAVLFGAGYLADRGNRSLTPAEIAAHDPAALPAFDRAAAGNWSPRADRASDVLLYGLTAAPLSLMLTDRGGKEPGTLGLMYLQTYALQGGVVYLLKNLVARSRPFVYNDDPAVPADLKASRTARRSFPSGHTSSAFAAMIFTATTYAKLYPDSGSRGWVWGGCLTAAATTAYLRYAAGRHFPTDILAGAAIGSLAGWLVPRWHEADGGGLRDPSAKSHPGLTVAWGFGF
jgi:membrane-associated phospholipid phosphatase